MYRMFILLFLSSRTARDLLCGM